MSLLNCPECSKEISDKAANCPYCGFPIDKKEELIQFPKLPNDLNIGKQIWSIGASMNGYYDRTENIVGGIPHGKIMVILHTHGIKIVGGATYYRIHNSQIISLKTASKGGIVSTKKSVIGRAVVGGLILGPVGAIVGGISGIAPKEKFVDKHYLIINYWDAGTKAAQTILVSARKEKIIAFIDRQNKEAQINEAEGRVAAPKSGCAGVFLALIISALLLAFL
jgi:hypothetical protein